MTWNAMCFHRTVARGSVLYIHPSIWEVGYKLPHGFAVGHSIAIEFSSNARASANVLAFAGNSLEIETNGQQFLLARGSMHGAPISSTGTPFEAWAVQ